MNKKNVLMMSIIVVCVVILVSLAINAFASAGGSLENCVSSGSCAGGEGGCSTEERASCGSESTGGSSCGSSSAGGGCGSTSIDYTRLEQEAVNYYSEQTGETNITAKAYNGTNGIEIAIIKDKQVVDILKYGTETNR